MLAPLGARAVRDGVGGPVVQPRQKLELVNGQLIRLNAQLWRRGGWWLVGGGVVDGDGRRVGSGEFVVMGR